jgi:hypothetical protein
MLKKKRVPEQNNGSAVLFMFFQEMLVKTSKKVTL